MTDKDFDSIKELMLQQDFVKKTMSMSEQDLKIIKNLMDEL